jgi:tetratricopeptide (TPR) repeat protein
MANNPIDKKTAIPQKQADAESLQSLYAKLVRPLLWALTAVLAALALGSWYARRRDNARAQAAELYWNARTPQELEAMTEDYSESPLASLALLKAAKEQYDAGEYAAALKLYRDFQEREPNHFMLDSARMGEWHSREMLGQIQEALRGFAQFVDQHAESPLAPQAVFGQSRCMEAMGLYENARGVLERFIESDRHAEWKDMAQKKLKALDRRATRTAASAVIPVPPAESSAPPPNDRAPAAPSPGADEPADVEAGEDGPAATALPDPSDAAPAPEQEPPRADAAP